MTPLDEDFAEDEQPMTDRFKYTTERAYQDCELEYTQSLPKGKGRQGLIHGEFIALGGRGSALVKIDLYDIASKICHADCVL